MITKCTLILVLCLTVISNGLAQLFEGKITYQTSYKSKVANIPDQQFNSMFGSVQEYLIKGGDYKSITNGTFLQWQLYLNKDNKLYSKMSNSPVILWNDGAVNPDEVIKSEVNKGVINILGHPCDELILTCKSGVQKYYYSPKFKVDASLFENHKFGNWSDFVSRANALPLKMIIDSPQFFLESVATEINSEKLNADTFQLPADSRIEKSPY